MAKLERHNNSLVANLFGLQLLRVWYHNHRLLRLREPGSESHSEEVEALLRDGVVVLQEFLPPAEFERVLREFNLAWKAGLFDPKLKEATSVFQHDMNMEAYGNHCPAIMEHFADNPLIRSIIAGAVGRQFREKGGLYVRRYARSSTPVPAKRMVGVEYLHADSHVPACKAFYFLADSDEKNGALVYARGSQRMRAARLAFEYRTSIKFSWAKHRKLAYTVIPLGNLVTPTARERRRMGIHETPIPVKANTLVIFNTRGFHRQGRFTGERPRDLIFIEYSHVTRGV